MCVHIYIYIYTFSSTYIHTQDGLKEVSFFFFFLFFSTQDGLKEVHRVLKPGGVFFATTFLWGIPDEIVNLQVCLCRCVCMYVHVGRSAKPRTRVCSMYVHVQQCADDLTSRQISEAEAGCLFRSHLETRFKKI